MTHKHQSWIWESEIKEYAKYAGKSLEQYMAESKIKFIPTSKLKKDGDQCYIVEIDVEFK